MSRGCCRATARCATSPAQTARIGSVAAVLAASEHAEAAVVADTLRRAHLVDDVPWSQMAVIVRSVPRAGAGLPRALTAAGVPVAPPAMDAPLPDNAVVRALLTALAATAHGLTATHALELLTGPIGRVDPVTLRQLRRALRRLDPTVPPREFGDLLVSALRNGLPDGLAAPHARPLRRVRAVLQGAARGAADPRSALWEVWQRSGLPRRLLSAGERGGQAGLRATQNLNAVTTLFDVADQFVSRTPGASIPGLLDHVDGLRLPVRAAEPVQTPEAVTILSPHQALGREWDVVVIAGLQEGLWPNTIPRGGILGTQRLLDVLDDVSGDVSARAPVVADERRLLIAAMGRARRRLVVTATDSGDGGGSADPALPSPFFYDIARYAATDGVAPDLPAPVGTPQVLSVPAVVGRLRAVVCAPEGGATDGVAEKDRAYAAGQLARLAAAGVPGADPADWHGMTTVSTAEPLWSGAGHTVTLSPSTLQTLQDCPLRWLLERHGGRDAGELRSTAGSLVHALIAQPGRVVGATGSRAGDGVAAAAVRVGVVRPQRTRAAPRHPGDVRDLARGHPSRADRGRHGGRRRRCAARRQRRRRWTGPRCGCGVASTGWSATPRAVWSSSTSRPARRRSARTTPSGTPSWRSTSWRSPRAWLSDDGAPGGGRLVYVGKAAAGGATEREQDALTPDATDEWRAQVGQAAAATAGPQFVARVNDGCAHCPVRPSCPAHHPSRGAVMTAAPRYSPTELAGALGLHPPTDEQAAVIAAPPGPLVVIAGAGAGKTETMAARVVWLVANGYADPGQVLGLTFTRKAAGQLLRRVRSRLARLAGAGLVPGDRQRGGRPGHRQHLSRVRRHAAARTRPAAAGRTRHPAAQRNRVVAVGFRRGVPLSR